MDRLHNESDSEGNSFRFSLLVRNMGEWQGVAMDSLKFYLGSPCLTLLRTAGRWPAAVFQPFGHPMPYAFGQKRDFVWRLMLGYVKHHRPVFQGGRIHDPFNVI